MIQACILDMDGVIVDTEPFHMEAFRIFLKDLDIPFTEQMIESMVGHSVEQNMSRIRNNFLIHSKFKIEECIQKRNKIYMDLIRSQSLKPLPGILDLIESCTEQPMKLGLASSSDSDQVKTTLHQLFGNHFGVLFDTIVTGSDVAYKKPAPDIYLKAVANLRLEAENCIAVEDSKSGIQSAKRAGLTCIALRSAYTITTDLFEADYIVPSISESCKIIFKEL